MKFLIVLLFSSLTLISCNNKSKTKYSESKSDFNLITDYMEFQKKMNDKDTINVWIAIPSCFPPIRVEKLTVSKENKLITINTSINNDIQKSNIFVEHSKVIISENDTVWKFEQFLKRNTFRTKTITNKKMGAIQLKYKSQKIHFFTKNKAEHNKLIMDYSETMKRINPYAETYLDEIEIVD